MGHHFGLLAHAHGIDAAGQSLGHGMTNCGQSVNHGVEAHGQSLVDMGYSHHFGLSSHGQGIAAAGQSLNEGMMSAGMEFNQGITALGHGFADMGWYVSRSVAFLAFALVVQAVVDLGFVYIVGALCMIILTMLLLWNLQLQARLAHQRRGQFLVQKEACRAANAMEHSSRLETELACNQNAISVMESQQNSLRCELAQESNKLRKTENDLEEARMLLLKMSSELTQAQNVPVGLTSCKLTQFGDAENPLRFMTVEKDAEMREAHRELQRVNQELGQALSTIRCLEGSEMERSKRQRSRV